MPTVIIPKFIPVKAFKKGQKPWNFGTAKITEHTCKGCGVEFKTKRIRSDRPNNYCSINCSISATHKPEVIKKRAITQTGMKRTEEFIKSRSGKNSPFWIEDRTQLKKSLDRRTTAYMEWVKNVYSRDNWKCKIGNSECNGRIEAHHILPWRDFVELRYEINNGITLCHFHHPQKYSEEKRLLPYFRSLLDNSEKI